MRKLFGALTLSASLLAFGQDFNRGHELYQHTDYEGSLKVLRAIPSPGAEALALMGQDYYMLGDVKRATDYLQKAFSADPKNSDYALWLGRAWGRRAETASPLTAPFSASKARQYFELAVQLNPRNWEATGDLMDYYLNAPGFLGGGLDKADALAKLISKYDAAEGYFAAAQVADRRKQYDRAEQQLRHAMELAPRQVGRVLDLARYLAKQGKVQESEAAFAKAEKMAPDNPRILYVKAKTYVEGKRNLDQARALLKKYLQSNITPQDPPREEAEKLLRKASSGA